MRGAAILRALMLAGVAGLLASCSSFVSAPTTSASKEFFSPAKYGDASPRVVAANRAVPKGGGYQVVGKPYAVAGRTYIPRDNPRYSKTGLASWYGSAFHGRLTANGEVYDVNGLTAAHPTLPLPTYVRVTNLENGRSLVVRVNDRGPFARNRLIDVSSRAADMLGFKRKGTAKVQVDYVGPARMDGFDERILLASYQGPSQGGIFSSFADNRTATAGLAVAAVTPKPRRHGGETTGDPLLLTPAYQTAAYSPEPGATDNLGALILRSGLTSSYAETPRPSPAQAAAAELSSHDLTTALTAAAAKKARELAAAGVTRQPATIQLGSFSTSENARRVAARFARYGQTRMQAADFGGRTLQTVFVTTDGSVAPEAVIDAAETNGLTGAFVVAR
jgi:rare lipoprotein A